MVRNFLLMALILGGGVLIMACDDSNTAGVAAGNFVAEISGAVTDKVSGPGLIRFLPSSEVKFGTRPGYFFIATETAGRSEAGEHLIFTVANIFSDKSLETEDKP